MLLQPSVSIITNIEPDHLINYENSFENLKNAFLEFIKNLPFNGISIVCGDDEVIKELKKNFQRNHISYGFEPTNDYVISNYKSEGMKSFFKLTSPHESIDLSLNMLGKHNVLNAAAAAILCIQEGISLNVIKGSLKNFMGIDRRMQILGSKKIKTHHCTYIDDYGHHPTEIKKTIEAIRDSYPAHKVIMIFQPHRFTRTKDLYEEFVAVLKHVDQLMLLDIYSAGEKEIEDINSENIQKSLIKEGFRQVHLFSDKEKILKNLDADINSDTVFVFQGAGDISAISKQVAEDF